MSNRTRLGKVVGSVTRPLEGWTYWPEANWQTRAPGFIVVAPSGARWDWHETEAAAIASVAEHNANS